MKYGRKLSSVIAEYIQPDNSEITQDLNRDLNPKDQQWFAKHVRTAVNILHKF